VRPDSYSVAQEVLNQRKADLLPRLIEEIHMRIRLIEMHMRDQKQLREEIAWLIELISHENYNQEVVSYFRDFLDHDNNYHLVVDIFRYAPFYLWTRQKGS
jgi:hypothetical protein